MKNKFLKFIQICFVAGLALIVFAGLGRALFAPKEINQYENRLANLMPEFSFASFLSVDYQDAVEDSLSDQIHCAEFLKANYNKTESGIAFGILKGIFSKDLSRSYVYNGLLVRGGDALLYYPKTLTEKVKTALSTRVEEINTAAAENPGYEFYVWFIEKETDINFESGNHMGHYDYFASGLNSERMTVGVDMVYDFEDYYRRFYKTDHHWNQYGSYEGYLELLEFLGAEGEPLQPVEEFLVGTDMSGSKAAYTRSTGVWVEDMYAYRFEFPQMSISINGSASEDYGHQNAAWPYSLTYGGYYGEDHGEIIMDTGREDRENILVIGDSYDNAVLKLLASHYNRTHSVDLRYYEHFLGEKFNLSEYLERNSIDKVLIIGSVNFYSSEDFSMR